MVYLYAVLGVMMISGIMAIFEMALPDRTVHDSNTIR